MCGSHFNQAQERAAYEAQLNAAASTPKAQPNEYLRAVAALRDCLRQHGPPPQPATSTPVNSDSKIIVPSGWVLGQVSEATGEQASHRAAPPTRKVRVWLLEDGSIGRQLEERVTEREASRFRAAKSHSRWGRLSTSKARSVDQDQTKRGSLLYLGVTVVGPDHALSCPDLSAVKLVREVAERVRRDQVSQPPRRKR